MDPSAGWFEGRTHHLPVRVYYEDTDFTGLVYHANYARYFERGRSDFLRLTGIDHASLLDEAKPVAFAVRRMTMDFIRPARIDDALTVMTNYDTVSGARINIAQTLMRGGEILAEAMVEVACIGLDGRPSRPPPGLAARLGPYLASPALTGAP
jgi:acyl-CoA thioester hydrolase